MNKQETFDTVARHLLTQNERSRIGGVGGSCVYRGPGGLRCAIGALIPSEMIGLVHSNNEPVGTLPDVVLDYLIPSNMDSDKGIKFLSHLQRIHDCFGPIVLSLFCYILLYTYCLERGYTSV